LSLSYFIFLKVKIWIFSKEKSISLQLYNLLNNTPAASALVFSIAELKPSAQNQLPRPPKLQRWRCGGMGGCRAVDVAGGARQLHIAKTQHCKSFQLQSK
jgi:hypothetical protein